MTDDQKLNDRVKKTFEILNKKLENEELTPEERKQIVYDLDHLIDYLPELEIIKRKEMAKKDESSDEDNQ